MGQYRRPTELDQALDALVARPMTILAGGTDFYPARAERRIDEDILDLTGIPALRGIERKDGQWRIGATTTWTDIVEADLPSWFRALKQAAREVGGVQIQNAGTVAGNLCNASPAADGAPVLLTLDASVELRSARGLRRLPLAAFLSGNRQTRRETDEILTAVLVPDRIGDSRTSFRKLGARRYLVISIVSTAVRLDIDAGGVIEAAAIAVGACAPTATRLPELEARLIGETAMHGLSRHVREGDLTVLQPIDDMRASAAYRREAVAVLLRRSLDQLATVA